MYHCIHRKTIFGALDMTILSKNDRLTLLLKYSIIVAMVMEQLASRQNSQIFAKVMTIESSYLYITSMW